MTDRDPSVLVGFSCSAPTYRLPDHALGSPMATAQDDDPCHRRYAAGREWVIHRGEVAASGGLAARSLPVTVALSRPTDR